MYPILFHLVSSVLYYIRDQLEEILHADFVHRYVLFAVTTQQK
jgi:hypothetical protein